MSDASESARGRVPLPVAILSLAIFFGAMRFDGFRPIGARVVAFALPLGVVFAGVWKLNDSHSFLRNAARLLGLLVLVTSELPGARLFLGFAPLPIGATALRSALVALLIASAVLEGVAARRSLRARVTAWLGIALGFAGYLAGATDVQPNKEFGLILVAGVIGLWGGGLGGLVLGALAAKVARGQEAEKPETKRPTTAA
jgi:hypothetical protein